jgi:hypothetical protein
MAGLQGVAQMPGEVRLREISQPRQLARPESQRSSRGRVLSEAFGVAAVESGRGLIGTAHLRHGNHGVASVDAMDLSRRADHTRHFQGQMA